MMGRYEGMQHFDGEIEKLIRAGMIDYDTAMAYATNLGQPAAAALRPSGEAPPEQQVKVPAPAPKRGKQETEIELESKLPIAASNVIGVRREEPRSGARIKPGAEPRCKQK